MSALTSQQSPQRQPSQVVDSYEQDGKHYLEVWLIDPTWNQNYWKANQDELTKKVQRFINKPAILTPYLHHPHEYEHIEENPFDPEGNVAKHKAIDERYRIGHITHVKPLSNSAYAGIIELTHPGAIAAFKEGKIPRFVSPAVYNLNMTGPQGEFTSFEPLHIAFVNEPAYGMKAQILNTCHDQQDTCLRNLGVAAVLGESCIRKALDKLENVYVPAHSSHMKSNASLASELTVKEDSGAKPVAATIPDNKKDKEDQQLPVQSTDNKKPEAQESKAPIKAETQQQEEEEEKPKGSKEPKDKDGKAVVGKEEIATVLESLKDYVKTQISESLQTYIEETRKEQEKTAAKDAKRKLIESYVTIESAGGSKEERDRRINALMHIPREELETFLEAHYKIAGKSRSNAAKASKLSDFNRGMPQNAQNNVGTAALLLDQDTNDRIDRVLSIGRFVPSARIVPNTGAKDVIE